MARVKHGYLKDICHEYYGHPFFQATEQQDAQPGEMEIRSSKKLNNRPTSQVRWKHWGPAAGGRSPLDFNAFELRSRLLVIFPVGNFVPGPQICLGGELGAIKKLPPFA